MPSSNGLMGLPHYRSSRVSTEMMEPVWTNLYTVTIQLPALLTVSQYDQNLLLEGLTKVDGLDTNKVPGANSKQTYKFAERRFADSGPDRTTLDIKFDFEINVRNSKLGAPDMYTLKILRAWNDLIYDPLTGFQGLKVDYVAPVVTVVIHDKPGNPFWQWSLYNVWPCSNLNTPSLDFMQKSQVYKVTGYTLACDFWDEKML